MEHFVTLFNKLYLPQGMALYQSMERHVVNGMLWVLCVDDESYEILDRLKLPRMNLLKLSVLETAELLRVKSQRTIGEYCWTLTPFSPKFVFESDRNIARVTYVDADLWFRKNPQPIFDELDLSKKQVLITDHGYSPAYDQSATSGQFCVQFMTFVRDGGEDVRQWWEDRCIEWCFSRFEDNKFGDQKYLDDWPVRFSQSVHVLQDKGLTLAPWNATRFPYGNSIFYHFHGLRIISPSRIHVGSYLLPRQLVRNVYRPYCDDLKRALSDLSKVGFRIVPQTKQAGLAWRIYLRVRGFCKSLYELLPVISIRL